MLKKFVSIKRIVVSFAVLLIIWHLAATFGGINPSLFPTPFKVAAAFRELLATGLKGSTSDVNLFGHILASMRRFLTGYILSVAAAVTLGLILGWFPTAFAYVNPVVQIIRPIAPVAWLPFIVLLVGIGDVPAIAIIFIAGFFPILLSTVTAVKNMDPIYLKVARNFDLSQTETLVKIVFPATFPQIVASLHQALSTCWIFLVSGEMVGSQSGLGFLVMDAKNCIRADALLATMLTIGVIGLLLDLLIGWIEKFVARKWGFGIVRYVGEDGE